MSDISFSTAQKETLVKKLQAYIKSDLDIELEQFDAEFLLDFISKEMGKFFYNQGLYDAQTVLNDKMESLTDAIYQLEKY